ncbi:MAG: hypothetical protein EHM58_18250 [Ignavibacteriae bacterium]|nr:MAG: hypothetical protein EHM58_18250 [Ignavibacteriota bacterium]
MEVFVFKTNIYRLNHLEKLKPVINNHKGIQAWSVDLQDIDKVLRVEAELSSPAEIIHLVNKAGFYCEELPD